MHLYGVWGYGRHRITQYTNNPEDIFTITTVLSTDCKEMPTGLCIRLNRPRVVTGELCPYCTSTQPSATILSTQSLTFQIFALLQRQVMAPWFHRFDNWLHSGGKSTAPAITTKTKTAKRTAKKPTRKTRNRTAIKTVRKTSTQAAQVTAQKTDQKIVRTTAQKTAVLVHREQRVPYFEPLTIPTDPPSAPNLGFKGFEAFKFNDASNSLAKSVAYMPFTPLGANEVRLFYIEASPDRLSEIRGELVMFPRHALPAFDALSYVWGGTASANSPTITINKNEVHITTNLHGALRALRTQNCMRPLWVDALCVNQKDLEERTTQVRRMCEFYRNATTVHIWLGPIYSRDGRQETVEEFTKDFTALIEADEIPKMPFYRRISASNRDRSGPTREMMKIFESPWFNRIWVVQEAAAAQTTTMHFGADFGDWSVSWQAGEQTRRLLRRLQYISICPSWALLPEATSIPLFSDDPYPREIDSIAKWYAPLIYLLELSVWKDLDRWPEPDLLNVLYNMRDKNATNPRDKIFGLLEVGPAQCSEPFEVDYKLSEKKLWELLLHHLRICPNHGPI